MNKAHSSPGFWRGYVLGGATLVLLGLLWQFVSQPPPAAYAQVPDSGAQRNRMIQEMVTSNKKLTQIVDVLKQIRDQCASETPAKKPGTPPPARP